MKTQINIFANLLLSEKYCANKGTGRGGEEGLSDANVCKICECGMRRAEGWCECVCVCVWLVGC